MAHGSLRTRFGTLDVACAAAGVTYCAWRDGDVRPAARAPGGDDDSPEAAAHCARVLADLRAYLRKNMLRLDGVPLVLAGTALECAIWRCVATLPFGASASYAEVARAVGHPRAHRAVARAMGRAPYALLIPAHRVVAADGTIRGAAPSSRRAALLAFERYGDEASRTSVYSVGDAAPPPRAKSR